MSSGLATTCPSCSHSTPWPTSFDIVIWQVRNCAGCGKPSLGPTGFSADEVRHHVATLEESLRSARNTLQHILNNPGIASDTFYREQIEAELAKAEPIT